MVVHENIDASFFKEEERNKGRKVSSKHFIYTSDI